MYTVYTCIYIYTLYIYIYTHCIYIYTHCIYIYIVTHIKLSFTMFVADSRGANSRWKNARLSYTQALLYIFQLALYFLTWAAPADMTF